MIRSEAEYRDALRRRQKDQAFASQQRAALVAKGLAAEQIERVIDPLLSFNAQLDDEIAWYERVRRGDFGHLSRLADIGQLLIALRIAAGMTQRQLADRLDVSEAQVSRDERNEYHGITVERAQRIIDALGAGVTVGVREPPTSHDRAVLAGAR